MHRLRQRQLILLGTTSLIMVAFMALFVGVVGLSDETMRNEQVALEALQAGGISTTELSPATATPAPSATLLAPPTLTFTDTLTPSLTPTISLTPSVTLAPTSSFTPTATPYPSLEPLPSQTPSLTATASPTFTPIPLATATPTQPTIPTETFTPLPGAVKPVPLVPTGDYDIFNILLLGSDQRPTDGTYRTDTMIVVSVNRSTNTVNMLSIPRDLYLYIPGFGFDRINTAGERGDLGRWPGGGPGLIADTITYNLGIRIDRYAEVRFDGFKQIIDGMGGIDVAVDCPLSDYKLASPTLDPNLLSSYAWYTLPIGYHHMDGPLALWYSRSRETTNDLERNRRQQLVLRAIWHKALDQDLVTHLPELWGQATKLVRTNMTLTDAAGLLPIAIGIDTSRLRSYFLGPGQVKDWTTPDGAAVLQAIPAGMAAMIKLLYTPPTQNRLFTEQPTLEIYNGTTHDDWSKVATSRLAWEGFIPTDSGGADADTYKDTVIYDYTGGAKPASLKILRQILNVTSKNVNSLPDPNRAVDFKVILGASYNSCTYRIGQAANQTN